ncbi:MAG: TonB-dependent receptor, partial [Aldersonia sp.]|nr:TonB-dependent receptor [Aldersonia sp.]
ERRIANEDRPNRFVLSGVYALPFGEGRRLGGDSALWLRKAISGWTVSGIYTYQSGSVVSWGNVIYLGGELNWEARNIGGAFDTTRFNTVPAQQLDRNLRTLPTDFGGYRSDGINTLNAAVIKNTALGRGVNLQLRGEAFNVFDRVQFGEPVLAPTNSNFGRIVSQVNAPRSVQFGVRLLW